MARLVAVLTALLRAVWRGERSLGSFASNNFFLVTAILLQYAGAFLYLILGLLMLFPLSTDPLRKSPPERVASWPLSGRDRLMLRMLSPWASPATWILAGVLIWSARRSMGFGLPLMLAAAVAAGFLFPRATGAGQETVWRLVPKFRIPLSALVQKNFRGLLSTLDFYCAVVLSVSGLIYRLVSSNPEPDARLGVTLLIVLALSSYGQSLFGLEREAGLVRYRLFPLEGRKLLAAKGAPFLAAVFVLSLPLAPLAGLSAGLVALAVGHATTVEQSAFEIRWRFTSGSSISNSLMQVVAMTVAGVATFRITPLAVVVCAVVYSVSVWWYGRRLDVER